MIANYLWLCGTAFLAGAINSLAGGGTLLTFPALLAALTSGLTPDPLASGVTSQPTLPPTSPPPPPSADAMARAMVLANGTSTVALFWGSLSSAWAYRQELQAVKQWVLLLMVPSVIGGVIGSLMVVQFPGTFDLLIPWLILTASLLFMIQPMVARWLGHVPTTTPTQQRVALVVLMQLAVAIYGGYFGAGIGILMLSALGFMGLSNIHEMNSLKAVLGSFINGTSVVVFVIKGNVHWPYAAAMTVSALIGGYYGAKYGRQLPTKYVRWFVIAMGLYLTIFFLSRQYAAWSQGKPF